MQLPCDMLQLEKLKKKVKFKLKNKLETLKIKIGLKLF